VMPPFKFPTKTVSSNFLSAKCAEGNAKTTVLDVKDPNNER
jgi:hypothetical protein